MNFALADAAVERSMKSSYFVPSPFQSVPFGDKKRRKKFNKAMGDSSWQYAAVLAFLGIFVLVLLIILVSVSKKGAKGDQGVTGPQGVTGEAGNPGSQDIALTASWTGPASDVSTAVLFTRTANTVTVFLEGNVDLFAATEAGDNPLSTALAFVPKNFRNNTSDTSFVVPTLLNNTVTSGLLTITIDGALIISPQLANTGFPQGSTNNGFLSTTVSYLIA